MKKGKIVCELEFVKDEIPEVQLRREFPNLSPPRNKKQRRFHVEETGKVAQGESCEVPGVQQGE